MNGMEIHIVIMVLVCLFTSFTFFRMFLRTRLKGHLLISIGSTIALIGGLGVFINEHIGNEKMVDMFGQIMTIPGIILALIGLVLIYTIESGAARSSYSGHSILDIVFGNVSSPEKNKYIPTLTRGGSVIGSSLLMIFGIAKCWQAYPSKSYTGIFVIAFGLAIFVVSIISMRNLKR